MLSARYEEINSLMDRLLELPPQERPGFLQRACLGDTSLQQTLEALLAAYESQDGFLDSPVLLELCRDQNAVQPCADLSGRVVGAYEILRPLGAGALAEVWLARDNRLQRRVALKILRPKFVFDRNHVLRFRQEAQAASKLSHPNIVTIHEIGESDGCHFIAQEFVDGVTLRTQLKDGPLSIASALDIAVQVTAALAVAHKAGIIHRDIKPENLMIRTDGLVKVLDFGIARVVEEAAEREDWRRVPDDLTVPGQILGTVKYMSPEQARGQHLDQRSDIFSFGAVLYEMVTGKAPFSRATNADTLAALLYEEPDPIARNDASPGLQQIVLRCLEKNRDKRISSAEEVGSELKSVALGKGTRDRSARESSETRKITKTRAWIGAGALIAAAVLVAGLFRAADHGSDAPPFNSIEMTAVTLPGAVLSAAISPDGKNVAYALQGPGPGSSLWVRQLASTLDKRIGPLTTGGYRNVNYSPDGAYLYYEQTTDAGSTLYRIRALGGEPQKVLDDVINRIAFAPDGRYFAFVQLNAIRREESVVVARADGGDERVVVTKRHPYYYSRWGVAWSGEGNGLFCLAGSESSYTAKAYRLVRVDLSSGHESAVGEKTWARAGPVISSLDGHTVVVNASERSDEELQLWRVGYPDGRVTRITRDLSDYAQATLSANSQSLLAIRRERTADLWTMQAENPSSAKQISNGDIRALNSAAWIRDKSIIYSASAGQFLNVWEMSSNGSDLKQLKTVNGDQVEIAATPNGRYILYQSGGKVWRMNADGSQPRQLTRGDLDVHPVASPDGRWVVYASFEGWSPEIGGNDSIWRVSIDGGEPVRITKDATSLPMVSPDGTLVAGAYFQVDKPEATPKIAVYKFDGGPALKVFDRPDGSDDKVYWSADGNNLEYIVTRGDVSNIWRQSLEGGTPVAITRFQENQVFFLDHSFDGKQILIARGKEIAEPVLISNLK